MTNRIHQITPENLTYEIIQDILENDVKLQLSEESTQLIGKSKQFLDKKLAESEKPLYGINTGFGALCNIGISKDELSKLQETWSFHMPATLAPRSRPMWLN
jgi:histidine ammonia-lyase